MYSTNEWSPPRKVPAYRVEAEVKERAAALFRRLAEAEAAVHGTSAEKVHFHEVGGIDTLVDVTGAALALELLEYRPCLAGIDHGGVSVVAQRPDVAVLEGADRNFVEDRILVPELIVHALVSTPPLKREASHW